MNKTNRYLFAVPEELVFTVDGKTATPARPLTLGEAGLKEREHLQEWVIAHPAILGEDVLIVTFEFDKWTSTSGERSFDRLDVLGLDRSGRLIVAELKRDRAADTITMQALNYAAMVSRFSLDTLVEAYASHRRDAGLTAEQAATEVREWAPEIADDTLSPPRIVLVAADSAPR